jgi:hypothetical protein
MQAFLRNTQPGVALNMPECLIVGGNQSLTTWDSLTFATPQGDPPAHILKQPANWNWDGTLKPWRSWLVLFMSLVATGQSGAAASVASVGGSGVTGVTAGFATLTGLSGLTAANVQQYITISGAASSGNNGTFQIVAVVSTSSLIIANPSAVAADANNGAIAWSIGAYPFIGPGPVWGAPGNKWGQRPSGSWALTCSSLLITSIRQILQRWKSDGTYYPHVVIAFGGGDATVGNDFSPQSTQGNGNADGTWGNYGKLVNGVWVPAKAPHNLFTAWCDGTGRYVRCNVHNVT